MIGEIDVYRGAKEVVTKLKKSQGKINHSLSESIDSLGVSPRVSIQLSEIYAWTIDFFKIQKGDEFNVYYENNYIDDKYIWAKNYKIPLRSIHPKANTFNEMRKNFDYLAPNKKIIALFSLISGLLVGIALSVYREKKSGKISAKYPITEYTSGSFIVHQFLTL